MDTNERGPMEDLLRSELRAPDFPAHEVRGRIRRTIAEREATSLDMGSDRTRSRAATTPGASRIGRWTGAVAAALLLFIAGAEYGRRSVVSTFGELAAVQQGAMGLPLAIQASGSSYVARLSELGAPSSALTERERELAREVAWATLHGAMVELERQTEGEEGLGAMIRLVESTRRRAGSEGHDAVLRF